MNIWCTLLSPHYCLWCWCTLCSNIWFPKHKLLLVSQIILCLGYHPDFIVEITPAVKDSVLLHSNYTSSPSPIVYCTALPWISSKPKHKTLLLALAARHTDKIIAKQKLLYNSVLVVVGCQCTGICDPQISAGASLAKVAIRNMSRTRLWHCYKPKQYKALS